MIAVRGIAHLISEQTATSAITCPYLFFAITFLLLVSIVYAILWLLLILFVVYRYLTTV